MSDPLRPSYARLLLNAAEDAMGVDADVLMNLTTLPGPISDHRHVAIEWEGGVIWLDMSDLGDHYCVDVRQFVPDPVRKDQSKDTRDGKLVYSADGSEVFPGETGMRPDHGVELAGQGVFTIVNGRRQVLAGVERKGDTQTYTYGPLADSDGTPVRGHGWNAGYVVTLMHDKAPSERQTNRPAGPGRDEGMTPPIKKSGGISPAGPPPLHQTPPPPAPSDAGGIRRTTIPTYVHVVEVFDRTDGVYVFADFDDAVAFEEAVNAGHDPLFGSRCLRREEVVCDHETTLKLIESERED